LIFPDLNGKIVKSKNDMTLEIIAYLRKTDVELNEIRLKTRMLAENQLGEDVYVGKVESLVNEMLNFGVNNININD